MDDVVELTRDCEAISIPDGGALRLQRGEKVRVHGATRAGATVLTEDGRMARIDRADADAIGRKPWGQTSAESDEPPAGEERVWQELRQVYDPEIPVNIVELGLVYGCTLTPAPGGAIVDVLMTLTAPGCGVGELIRREIEERLKALPGVTDARVEIVFDPPWSPEMMTEAAKVELGFL